MMDLALVSGSFLDEDVLPKEKRWLYRYFDTDVQRQFVRYFFAFSSFEHFSDHTGYRVTTRWLAGLAERLKSMEARLAKARVENDFETVASIESGKYHF